MTKAIEFHKNNHENNNENDDESSVENMESIQSTSDYNELQIVPYCYFLHYARSHDSNWQHYIAKIKDILMISKKMYYFRNEWPDEVIMNIISYMDAKSITTSSLLSKQWYMLTSENQVWEGLCRHHYGISSELCNHKGCAKELYRLMLDSFRSVVKNRNAYNRHSSLHMNFILPRMYI